MFKRISRKKWIPFYWHMHYCLASGVELETALRLFKDQNPCKFLKKFVERVLDGQRHGLFLSTLFKKRAVPERHFTATLLKSAENTGCYESVFKDLAVYQTWKLEVLSKINQILQYPVFLLLLSFLMLGFTLFILIPELHPVLVELSGTASPQIDRIYHFVQWLEAHGLFLLGCILMPLGVFFLCYRIFDSVKETAQKIFYQVPVFGSLARDAEMAHFGKMMAMLLSHSVSLMDILELQKHGHSLLFFRHFYQRAQRRVERGLTLSDALNSEGVFSPLMIQMIHAGESSGTLMDTSKTAAVFFTEAFHRRVDGLLRALPTCILLFVGSVFVFIMVQVILPLYDVISGVGFA